MAQFLFDKDVRISPLRQRTIAIIGYGNQGGAQALNLRDSGCRVVVGNRNDRYARQARDDGFEVMSIRRAVTAADMQSSAAVKPIEPKARREDCEPNMSSASAVLSVASSECTRLPSSRTERPVSSPPAAEAAPTAAP